MLGLKGYSYLWLLIIIIIGSFFLAGGQFMFEDLNELGIEITPTPASGAPGGVQNPATQWDLAVQKVCLPNKQTRVTFSVSALTYPAYLAIQIKNDAGVFVTDTVLNSEITSVAGNAPSKTFNSAYADREWQAILYEGSAIDPSKQKAQLLNQPPTACP